MLDSFIIQKKSRFTSAAKWVAELNSRQKNNTKLLSERHSSHIFFLHFGIIFKYSNTEVTIVGIVHDQMMQWSTFKTKSNENVSMLIYLLNFHLQKIFFIKYLGNCTEWIKVSNLNKKQVRRISLHKSFTVSTLWKRCQLIHSFLRIEFIRVVLYLVTLDESLTNQFT